MLQALPAQMGVAFGFVGHFLSHRPQLFGSVAVFTQPSVHSMVGNTHAKSHWPSAHSGSALAGGMQMVSQSPQCEVLLIRSTQDPSQSVVVPPQVLPQVLLAQTSPFGQAFGHEPQCALSEVKSTQALPHRS